MKWLFVILLVFLGAIAKTLIQHNGADADALWYGGWIDGVILTGAIGRALESR